MIWATDPNLTPAGRWAWIVALGGLIGLGAYDLSLKDKSPTSEEIFRDNMIGINAIVLSTAATKWFVGRRSAPRP